MHSSLLPATFDGGVPVHLILADDWAKRSAGLPDEVQQFAAHNAFRAGEGECLIMPDSKGHVGLVLFGLGSGEDPRVCVALGARLPSGAYRIASGLETMGAEQVISGFVDGAYRFRKYLKDTPTAPQLVLPEGVNEAEAHRLAVASDRLRDLVNTPAEQMGPDAIEHTIRNLAMSHQADVETTIGADLLAANYPMIHAVGRAGPKPPRLVELTWGREGDPVLAIVGKGVCFDTGGLNLKTGNFMRDMKKDMGGAAHAIALAELVMAAKLPVRLVLLVPAVENSVAGNSFRPGDVFPTRKGLHVEIDNTDAEGRLVLADALARACEFKPDLILDYATLTGAARVALGPDLAPYYTDDADLAAAMDIAAMQTGDPCWRMPLWKPYYGELKSSVCDIVNSGGPMAGSVTAALFLQKFVDTRRWVHFDVWAWRQARYGRPAGAAACGLRAGWQMLQNRYLD